MFDKPGNILFVFHYENTGTHTATLVSQRFCWVTERLNVGYGSGIGDRGCLPNRDPAVIRASHHGPNLGRMHVGIPRRSPQQ
jgi:hypothetical protein